MKDSLNNQTITQKLKNNPENFKDENCASKTLPDNKFIDFVNELKKPRRIRK